MSKWNLMPDCIDTAHRNGQWEMETEMKMEMKLALVLLLIQVYCINRLSRSKIETASQRVSISRACRRKC